jgi:integrase
MGLDFRTRLYDAALSPRRINLILLVLKMILKAAGYPVTDVKQLRVEKSDIDPLAPHEATRFWRSVRYGGSHYSLFCCGARPGELAAIKWGDVDWSSKTFRIRARRLRGVESAPKTRSSTRNVDMLAPTLEALKVQQGQQAAARLKYGQGRPEEGKDYVFIGTQGGCLSLNFIREKVWLGCWSAPSFGGESFYQTRHTFASNALAAGENPKWVADMLDHKSTEILFNVYDKFIPRRTRLDGSAFVARMKEESEAKTEPYLASQYDPNTTVFAPPSKIQ